MAKEIAQILGAKNMVGMIQGVKGGVPDDLIPPQFMATTRSVEGDHCTYLKVEGTRKTARQVQFGAPSKMRNLVGISEVPVKLMHTKEHIYHKPAVLLNLKSMENESKQKLGRQEVARQTVSFNQLFKNLRVAQIYSVLKNGNVWFDKDGNLLASSSGARVTIDVGVSVTNQGTLDTAATSTPTLDGTGSSIISAKWSAAATGIHKQISALKKNARKLTGYPIKYALYGDNILDYFLTNTKLKEIINRNPKYQTAFAEGEIADGFLGLTWIPAGEAFFEDADGTNQDFWGANDIVFCPEVSPEWWEVIEGSYPIPTDVGSVESDGVSALANVVEVNGMFQYAVLKSDPVGIKQIAGDTYLALPKVPNAIYQATVHW